MNKIQISQTDILEFRYLNFNIVSDFCLTPSIPSRLALRPETQHRGKTRRRERHEADILPKISKFSILFNFQVSSPTVPLVKILSHFIDAYASCRKKIFGRI